METNNFIKVAFVQTACFLLILLFVYASLSKVLTFDLFQTQLAQSPLLSAFSESISYLVLITELTAAVLLAIPRTRFVGLYMSFVLMLLFTIYIAIILTYSSFVPCSCGGILEKLGWKEHLYFNIAFTALALVAMLLERRSKAIYISSIAGAVVSVAVVIGMYAWSESIMHHQNPFLRRFDKGIVVKSAEIQLRYHNYYIAGAGPGKVFLGNTSAPLEILELDTLFRQQVLHTIRLDNDNHPFRSVQIAINYPHFFVVDGTVPVVYKGQVGDWKAKEVRFGQYYFSKVSVIDSNRIAFRALHVRTKENILGRFDVKNQRSVLLNEKILQKQVDGIFDTDGTFAYDPFTKKLVYTYYYRNQFMVMSDDTKLEYRGNTIDTTTRAKIKVNYITKSHEKRPSVPAIAVNKFTTASNGHLFVQSTLRGNSEPLDLWSTSSVVDIYALKDGSYLSSFYVYDIEKQKLNGLFASDNSIYVLVDKVLQRYDVSKKLN